MLPNKKEGLDKQGISNWNMKKQISFWNKPTKDEILESRNKALVYFSVANQEGAEFRRKSSDTFGSDFDSWIKNNNLDFKVQKLTDINSFSGPKAQQLISIAGRSTLSQFQYETESKLYSDKIKKQSALTKYLINKTKKAVEKVYYSQSIQAIGDSLEKTYLPLQIT